MLGGHEVGEVEPGVVRGSFCKFRVLEGYSGRGSWA